MPAPLPAEQAATATPRTAPVLWFASLHSTFRSVDERAIAELRACGYQVEAFFADADNRPEFAAERATWARPLAVFVSAHGEIREQKLEFSTEWGYLPADAWLVELGTFAGPDAFFWIDTCHSGALAPATFETLNVATSARAEENADGQGLVTGALVHLLCDAAAFHEVGGDEVVTGSELKAAWTGERFREPFELGPTSREVSFLPVEDRTQTDRLLAEAMAAVEASKCEEKCTAEFDAPRRACGQIESREETYRAYGDGSCSLELADGSRRIGEYDSQKACEEAAHQRFPELASRARLVYEADTYVHAFVCRYPFPRATGRLVRHSPVIPDKVQLRRESGDSHLSPQFLRN